MLLSKLEARFHKAGHKNVRFVIVTKNESNAERIRNLSPQLDVIVMDNLNNSQISNLEDRATYVFDSCGRVSYVIHYPYSSVQKPFVKAAILSTIFDAPCGDSSCLTIVSYYRVYRTFHICLQTNFFPTFKNVIFYLNAFRILTMAKN